MEREKDLEIEKKKEYLRGYEKAIRRVKRCETRIDAIRMNKMHPSLILDGLPHGSVQSDLSSYAAKLDEEEQKYLKTIKQEEELRAEITDKIEKLEDEDEKDVLLYRYIALMKWEDVATKMGFSRQHTHKIHARALKNFKMR